jgi:hypothetical protein
MIVATLLSASVGARGAQDTAQDMELLAAAFSELIRLVSSDAPRVEGGPIFCLGLDSRLGEVRDPPEGLITHLANVEHRLLPSSACTAPPLKPGSARYAVRVHGSDRIASLLYVGFESDPVADTVVTMMLRQYVGPRWASVWKCSAVATECGWTVGDCRLFEQS